MADQHRLHSLPTINTKFVLRLKALFHQHAKRKHGVKQGLHPRRKKQNQLDTVNKEGQCHRRPKVESECVQFDQSEHPGSLGEINFLGDLQLTCLPLGHFIFVEDAALVSEPILQLEIHVHGAVARKEHPEHIKCLPSNIFLKLLSPAWFEFATEFSPPDIFATVFGKCSIRSLAIM